MIWDEEYETMPREEIKQLQLEELQSTLHRVYKNVSFYKNLFHNAGFSPEDLQSLDDLARLPFTTKDDLRDSYPYGMFATPLREVVRIHSSSGTTGKPTVVGYTKNDIHNWSELVARLMTAAGVTKDDVVQISFDYGLFTGGFGLHYGAERIGASVIPMSSGNIGKQIMIMQDYKTTALICTPSYALYMAEMIEEIGINVNALSLRLGLFGAEPWSENMRQKIEDKLHIIATDNYGLSEVIGPGVAGECQEKNGLHLFEDYFIPEIINPETGHILPEGEKGELVITTIKKEAFPLIRYRTGDITSLNSSPCPCGRTLIRMSRVNDRTDDMLIINGINVFPSQIEHILMDIEGIKPHYQIVVERVSGLDELEVQVEVSENIFFDEMGKQTEFMNNIKYQLSSILGFNVHVKLVEPKTLARTNGKTKRVIDKRNNNI